MTVFQSDLDRVVDAVELAARRTTDHIAKAPVGPASRAGLAAAFERFADELLRIRLERDEG